MSERKHCEKVRVLTGSEIFEQKIDFPSCPQKSVIDIMDVKLEINPRTVKVTKCNSCFIVTGEVNKHILYSYVTDPIMPVMPPEDLCNCGTCVSVDRIDSCVGSLSTCLPFQLKIEFCDMCKVKGFCLNSICANTCSDADEIVYCGTPLYERICCEEDLYAILSLKEVDCITVKLDVFMKDHRDKKDRHCCKDDCCKD